MNTLPLEKKILVLNSLVEGNSIRSTVRLTGVNKKTVMRLLVEAGSNAMDILDREIVNIQSRFVQCDEIWCYVGKKQKQCTDEEKQIGEVGDQYIFVAMDSDSKLIVSHLIGKRTMENARSTMKDLNYRIPTRFQLSTDAYSGYYDAVDSVFGTEIDYGTVHKNYAEEYKTEKRYSPAHVVSTSLRIVLGEPLKKRISTSHVERQNLTMRMNMRRLTRLTNGFSKKLINLKAATALHFYHYNFMRIHQTLRVTPAMQANVTHRLWTWENLLLGTQLKQAA